jgi:hypothetical protein
MLLKPGENKFQALSNGAEASNPKFEYRNPKQIEIQRTPKTNLSHWANETYIRFSFGSGWTDPLITFTPARYGSDKA